MHTMPRIAAALAALVMMSTSADAALLSRASGAAYYDDVLNITWLADANAGAGSSYDDGASTTDGRMTWASAQAWVGSLNTANYLGVNTWRLPEVTDTGMSGCDFAYTGTDCGYNVDLSTGEMAHLFYSTLGNLAYYDTSGVAPQPGWGLSNTGPFSNLQSYNYWSGATYAPSASDAWLFGFDYGGQYHHSKSSFNLHAWAVSSGDVLVPVPAAVWMLGSALGVLGLVRRKMRTGTA